jgi:AraC-like DNA-binding protein
VVRGSATFGVGDRVSTVSEGGLIAFPPGQDHVLLESSPDLYLYAVGLAPEYSTEVCRAGRESLMPLQARLTGDELAVVVDRAAAIVDRTGADQLGAELWERVHWLGRRASARPNPGTHVLTRRVLAQLESSPELGLEALSNELRSHTSEISRHFHRDLGMTLVRYRARLRLLHVIRLFDTGKHDLFAAANAAGFGSYSQCHRTFQAELACAPRQFFGGQRQQMQLAYAG